MKNIWFIADKIYIESSLLDINNELITVILLNDLTKSDIIFTETDKICITSESCLDEVIKRITNLNLKESNFDISKNIFISFIFLFIIF